MPASNAKNLRYCMRFFSFLEQVTLVANLELYGVDVAEFAKECQHGIAASATINPLPARKGVQLQVQGNQVLFVSRLLHCEYRAPHHCRQKRQKSNRFDVFDSPF